MAFVTRSNRQFSGNERTADAEVPGPGTYSCDKPFRKKADAYAPFQSTTLRDNEEKTLSVSCAPPPGHYDPKLPGTYESGLPKKFVPFKSTSSRFTDKATNDCPGPGSYDITKSSGRRKDMYRTMGAATLDPRLESCQVRALSAPSIPARAQSFGYEEGSDGRLTRQPAPDMTSGRSRNSIGPDHYCVDDRATKKRVTGGLMRPAPSEGGRTPGPTPGPGHYMEVSSSRAPKRPGAAFVSKVARMTDSKSEKSVCPGPGQYDTSKPSRGKDQEHQFFGSTVERFTAAKEMQAPGPGAYQVCKGMAKSGGVLATKTNRFRDRREEDAPGPGQYEASEGFGMDAEKALKCQKSFSVLGNQGALAFGAMSCRFVKSASGLRESNTAPGPGPGAYEHVDIPGKLYKTQPSSFFKSKTKERRRDIENRHPAPGAYDPQHMRETGEVVRIQGKKEGFLTGSDRFGTSKTSSSSNDIGPGQYNPSRSGPASFNRAMGEGGGKLGGLPIGFVSCTNRFDDGSPNKRPGPGQYNTDSNWVKKSYNCLFGEVL